MPSGECYNVLQDSKGYIWIATDAGFCRYNGHSLKIYNKNEGLPEGAVYFIREEKDGSICAITSKNRLLKIRNDSVFEDENNAAFMAALASPMEISYSAQRAPDGNLILNSNRRTYNIHCRTHRVANYSEDIPVYGTEGQLIVDARNGEPMLIRNCPEVLADTLKAGIQPLKFITEFGTLKSRVVFNPLVSIDFRIKAIKQGDYIFLNVNQKLIRVGRDMKMQVYEFPTPILSMYPDQKGGLWIGTSERGLYYYSDVASMKQTGSSLDNFSVSGIWMDKEGGIWCTTIEKGVFYCSNPYLTCYFNLPELSKSASLLKFVDNKVFVSSRFNQVCIIQGDTLLKKDLPVKSNSILNDVVCMNNEWFFTSKSEMIVTHKDFTSLHLVKNTHLKNYFYSYRLDTCRGKIYGTGLDYVFRMDGHQAFFLKDNLMHRFKSLCMSGDTLMLLGATDGLYSMDLRNLELKSYEGIHSYVSQIIRRSDQSIWIATKGEGLFKLKENKLERVTLQTGVQPLIIFDLAEDRYKRLWIASNTGLLRLGKEVCAYTTLNALPSGEVNKLAIDSSFIYLSTVEGVCRLPLGTNLPESSLPLLYLSGVSLKGKPLLHLEAPPVFSHPENSFVFTFDVPVYRRAGGDLLLYQLAGNDPAWKRTALNEIRCDNLSPGTYELTVYALNSTGQKSAQPVRFKFVIRKPLWQRTWFIGTCFILFFLLVLSVTRGIIKNIRRREEEKTRVNKMIAGSQLMALQARMNPHFIFNAINSIQSYVLRRDDEAAYSYLTKFSRLIRKVLNNSGSEVISLREELETIQLYVELEQLRFENSFEFQLSVSEHLDEDEFRIPVMFIQPYVENAIGHGLMNLDNERPALLKLSVTGEKELLKIVIEDNGVGRAKAAEYKKGSLHRPLAMNITAQRLEMIRKNKNFEAARALVTDLYDDTGMAAGTRVELFLPLHTNL